MRLPKTVQIITTETQYDSDYGHQIGEIETVVGSFKAEIEPYSSQLALKQYGVSVEVTNRMFCEPQSLELGTDLKYKNKNYKITGLLDYEKHMEVLLHEQ